MCTELGKEFLGMTTKAQSIKEKIDKLDLLKIKTFSHSKHTINTIKRQATNLKKVFSDHISVKDFYLEYITSLEFNNNKQLNSKISKLFKKTFQ